jgi:hypothetical protein
MFRECRSLAETLMACFSEAGRSLRDRSLKG